MSFLTCHKCGGIPGVTFCCTQGMSSNISRSNHTVNDAADAYRYRTLKAMLVTSSTYFASSSKDSVACLLLKHGNKGVNITADELDRTLDRMNVLEAL